ncbi:hypothetical protein AX17_004071 [Amanita inopinata Kibby_2008]|nr:hypothetical protein AX17_004071 [Amanita inopinata Kibby_2008]
MGKNKRKNYRGSRKNNIDEGCEDRLLERIDMNNPRFSAYYKAQEIVPDDEWDTFLNSMRQHLPTTFRVAGSRQTAQPLNTIIKELHVPSLSNIEFEGQRIAPPVQIPWYPDGLAWHFNVPKKVLRKQAEFKKFHSFLVFETEIGNISRQEGVSMLPPLFLGVESHHKVMDMCAAPGSKTAQILEALHADDTATSSSIPAGLLLANDNDHKRTHLLIHQVARLPSPALMVTNLDASNYPVIKVPVPGRKKLEQLLFDRILCDVPCSGDGTMRKNIGIWKSWQPGDANGLHNLQVRILQRAMKLLQAGGRIVYSTCSLNPVENEAVVAEALNANTDFELVNVSDKLPELKRRPGLTSWRPTVSRNAEVTYQSYIEFVGAPIEPMLKSKLSEGHWPPTNVEQLNLHHCVRIYPHLQDTGGFFIAVLERKKSVKSSSPLQGGDAINSGNEKKREFGEADSAISAKKPRLEPDSDAGISQKFASIDSQGSGVDMNLQHESLLAPETGQGLKDTGSPTGERGKDDETLVKTEELLRSSPKTQGGDSSFKENPYTFLRSDDAILLSCIERLHLTTQFPASNILVRNPEGEAARSLYLTNDIVKTIIQNNDYTRIRLTAAGTKVMAKQEAGKGADAQFRVLGEGLPIILPFVDESTIVAGDLPSLRTLLSSNYPLLSTFEEPFKGMVQDRLIGNHLVKFPIGHSRLEHDLVLPIWKSNASLTLMIDKKAKSALSLRMFGVDLTPKRMENL